MTTFKAHNEASPNRSLAPKPSTDDRIQNLQGVIKYINKLITKYLTEVNELQRQIQLRANRLPSKDLQKEYLQKIYESNIFNQAKKNRKDRYKIVGTHASEITLKLLECIAVVQALQDKARKDNKLDNEKGVIAIRLIGSLKELLEMFDTFNNEVNPVSKKSNTHIKKTTKSIQIYASMLLSVERSFLDKDDTLDFIEKLSSLPQEVFEDVLYNFIMKEFKPPYLLSFDTDIQQKSFDILLKNSENLRIDPTTLLALYQNMRTKERQDFLKFLSTIISGNDMTILKSEAPTMPK